MTSITSPALWHKNISMKMNGVEPASSSSRKSRKPRRNVEQLALHCQDMEEATRLITSNKDSAASLAEAREKSSSQAQYANLLFRNYTRVVWEKYGRTINDSLDDDADGDFFLGITSGCSGMGLEGNGDILHGDSARGSFIVKLRALVGVFSGIAFVVFVSLRRFNKQRLEVSDFFRDDSEECMALANSVNGSFDMSLYHIVASGCFFMCFVSVVLIFYTLQPVDHAGQKFVPGLSALINGDRSEWSNYARRGADWLHRHSKFMEACTDGVLLAYALFFSVCASIALDSGNRFTFSHNDSSVSSVGATHTHTVSVQYYTISTIWSTFSHNTVCVDGADPAGSLRAGMSLNYLAIFALALCFRVSYSAYRKASLRRERDTSLSLTGTSDGGGGRSPLLHSHHLMSGRGSSSSDLEDGGDDGGDDAMSPGLADRMGMDGDAAGSDSELDVVLDSTQSDLSFHGAGAGGGDGRGRGDSSSDDGYDDHAPFAV